VDQPNFKNPLNRPPAETKKRYKGTKSNEKSKVENGNPFHFSLLGKTRNRNAGEVIHPGLTWHGKRLGS